MAFTVSEEHKSKIIALINALAPQAKIYLFGSRARGKNAEWSDIDLALDAGSALPESVIGELNSIMEASNLPYKVDVLDFHHNISELMRQEILKDKVVWKQ